MTNQDATSSAPNSAPNSNPDSTSATPAPRQFERRLYHGGCACGAVRYEVTLDLSAGTTRCNCTMCTKTRGWSTFAKPEDFKLLTPEENLSDFQRHGKFSHFLFCKQCGVRSFGRGDAPWMGGAYISVSVNCLEDADLDGVIISNFDGLHDNWENPRIERHVAHA